MAAPHAPSSPKPSRTAYLPSPSLPQTADKNCAQAENGTGACVRCASGFRMAAGACQPCASRGCADCSQGASVCSACAGEWGAARNPAQKRRCWAGDLCRQHSPGAASHSSAAPAHPPLTNAPAEGFKLEGIACKPSACPHVRALHCNCLPHALHAAAAAQAARPPGAARGRCLLVSSRPHIIPPLAAGQVFGPGHRQVQRRVPGDCVRRVHPRRQPLLRALLAGAQPGAVGGGGAPQVPQAPGQGQGAQGVEGARVLLLAIWS